MHVVPVICAAGAGTRMGRTKALCHFEDGRTFLERICETLLSCQLHDVVVVVGAQGEEIIRRHPQRDDRLHLTWVHNKSWATTHLMDSFRLGCEHLGAEDYVLQWPIDCPNVDVVSIQRLIHQKTTYLSVLSFDGFLGHPVLWHPQARQDWLESFSVWTSLQEFLRIHHCRLQKVQATSSTVLENINSGDFL